MSVLPPKVIESSNLSEAWLGVLRHAHQSTRASLAPIVVSIHGFSGELPPEVPDIRNKADATLVALEKNEVRVSALTIFPYEMWIRRGRPSCREFSDFCVKRLAPRLKRLDARNRNGLYFERMMQFVGVKQQVRKTVNQLETVIDLLNARTSRWPRQSALQIACFDPAKDHTGQPVRGFPCLQQVSVAHDYTARIALNAYYPTQYVFDRGYGNYLGLCQLGAFIAHHTGLQFTRLNCYVGRPELGKVSKQDVQGLVLDSARAD